jgi:hypothetical protein
MGFFDKIKGAVNAVTGGGATVTLDYQPTTAFPGEMVLIKISITSTGSEIKSKGVFVDLVGREQIHIRKNDAGTDQDLRLSGDTLSHEFNVAPAFVLGAGETKLVETQVQLPGAMQPSFAGSYARHEWTIRGRLEAFGNDPDSGYAPIRVGLKA